MNSKVLTLLGFAAKARKLSYGMNATVFSVKQKKARTVLVASDISDKSKKEVNFYCEKFGVNFIINREVWRAWISIECAFIIRRSTNIRKQ